MKHTLFSSYFWESDEEGKDQYDYAREFLFDEDTEHRFTDEDYCDADQMVMENCESYTCPVCGETFETLEEAKECCREEKWETEDDVPDEMVTNEVYSKSEFDWDEFEYEFSKFINESPTGFLLCGTCGCWDGRYDGGCYVNKFDDLYKFWDGCDYIEVYDEKGHLYIRASHHDGTNYAELKQLTDKGCQYVDNHLYDSDREVHEALFNSNFYTRLPHYAHKVWGCKKGA